MVFHHFTKSKVLKQLASLSLARIASYIFEKYWNSVRSTLLAVGNVLEFIFKN